MHGHCECGAVRFEINGPLRGIVACHCTQCRRSSGHYTAYTSAAVADIAFEAAQTLQWYRSSTTAERGFCRVCGSNLFWRPLTEPQRLSVAAGALVGPTGLQIERHIFVADQGDYYRLGADEPQHQTW